MKTFLTGLSASTLIMAAIGQAQSDSMYWTEIRVRDIRQANLDGTGKNVLIKGLNYPWGIALDAAGGRMYWTDVYGGDIQRANLDGTGQQTLSSGLIGPAGIALDLVGGRM